jgi:CubicO group peptidase (beta-lactamase class C family)
MPGTGDVWSTAGDLARFLSALHSGQLLPSTVQPLLHQLRVPHPNSSEGSIRASAYGAGHFIGTVDGHRARLHPGDNPGYQSLAVWLPETSTVAVVLSNDEAVDIETTALSALREAGR